MLEWTHCFIATYMASECWNLCSISCHGVRQPIPWNQIVSISWGYPGISYFAQPSVGPKLQWQRFGDQVQGSEAKDLSDPGGKTASFQKKNFIWYSTSMRSYFSLNVTGLMWLLSLWVFRYCMCHVFTDLLEQDIHRNFTWSYMQYSKFDVKMLQ